MKFLLSLAALALFSMPVLANDAPPPVTGAPVASQTPAPPPPAPTPDPAAAATVTAAKKEEEENQPGFIARVLAAATGNKTMQAQMNDKDARIAALEKENEELKARVAAQDKDIAEATTWIQGVSQGKIDPVKNAAPSPAAAAVVQAVQTATSVAVKKIGIPTTALEQPPPAAPAAALPNPQAEKAAKWAAVRAAWAAAGHSIPSPVNPALN